MNSNKDRAELLKIRQDGVKDNARRIDVESIIPKTPKEKIANFFFQYKVHILIIVAIILVVVSFIHDIVTRVDYDVNIMMVTEHYFEDETIDNIEFSLRDIAKDINGDGEVHVFLNYIFLNTEAIANAEQEMAGQMKVVAELALGEPYILIFDEVNYLRFFEEQGLMEVVGNSDEFGRRKIEETILKDFFQNSNTDYYVALRTTDGINMDKDEKLKAYEETKRIFDEIVIK